MNVKIEKIDNNNVSVEFNSSNYFGENQENWIALFKKDAPSTVGNILNWEWDTLVYFIRDAYIPYGQTRTLEVKLD